MHYVALREPLDILLNPKGSNFDVVGFDFELC
jgi:hypothetical protein